MARPTYSTATIRPTARVIKRCIDVYSGFSDDECASGIGSDASSPYTIERFYDDMLKCHNEYRRKHKVHGLVLNAEVIKQ